MADLDLSPIVQNGGGGSVGVGGVNAPNYQQSARVNTDLPNNEGARRAQALREAFQEFEGLSGNVANQLNTQAGALAGAASGATGHPAYKQGLARLTAYGRAFNNAATGAYAVEAEAQADDAAARLRVQANNDPATFAKTYGAVRDGVLKNAPALAVPVLTEIYNRRLAEGIAAISGDQAAEQKQLQAKTWELGIQRQTSRVAILQGSADPHDQLQAQDEQVKLNMLIEGGVKSGLYSPAQAQAMHINAARQVTAEVFQTQVDRELANPDGNVMGLIDRFRAAHIANISNKNEPPILSEDEFQSLMQNATQKVREYRLTQELARMNGRTAEQQRYEAGDKFYTGQLLAGTLTLKGLHDGEQNGDITPERSTALRTQLLQGPPQVKSDQRAILRLKTSPRFLDMSQDEIINTPGVNAQDASKLIDEQEKRRNSWEGTQSAKDARGVILDALKVPRGTSMLMLSPGQAEAASHAIVDFTSRINALEPSKRDHAMMTTAQQVVKEIKQQQAASQLETAREARERIIEMHGPNSDAPWSKETMDSTLKRQDALIQQLQQAAGVK